VGTDGGVRMKCALPKPQPGWFSAQSVPSSGEQFRELAVIRGMSTLR
jgi:hypothetical protein